MKEYFRELLNDIAKLFRASKTATGSLFLVAIYLGVGPLLLAFTIGKFFDALVGARGLRVMTSDVVKWFWVSLALVVVWLLIRGLAQAFSGLMLSLEQRLRRLIRIIISAILAFVVVPLHTATATACVIFAQTREDSRFMRGAQTIIGLLFLAAIYQLLQSTVIRDATLGQFICWSAAIVIFGRELWLYENHR